MKLALTRLPSLKSLFSTKLLVTGGMSLALAVTAAAQGAQQLSLADLLIGLRSKKVSLQDRNKILTDAVQQRGITFMLSPEIEKELETTGAAPELIAAVRDKSGPVKVALQKPVVASPAAPAPDFGFFKARADASAVKGDFMAALKDYDKSLELKSNDASLFFSRGRAHFNLKAFSLAAADFEKAIALDPKDALSYFNRAISYERLGQPAKAAEDYQKTLELDPSNEQAKSSLKKLNDEIAAAAERAKPKPEAVKPPEFVSRGTLAAEQAVKLVTPVYSAAAQRASVEGRVIVEVEIDEEGNVVEAEATNGHQMLRSAARDAAARSKFLPGMFDRKPIKSKGVLVYNFSLKK